MTLRRRLPLAAAALALIAGAAAAGSDFVYAPSRTATGARNGPRKVTPPPLTHDAAGYPVPRGLTHESVTIECGDGYRMGASYLKRTRLSGKIPGVIFLHDAGKERHEFFPLTIHTAARNCGVLALDLRGHGEDPGLEGNPPTTASKLTDADWAKMLEDVRNAVSYLAIKNEVEGGRIALIGSGLGANLALVAASQSWAASIVCVIAFSPTADNRGYRPVEAAGKIGSDTAVFLVAPKGNQAAHDAATAILAAVHGRKELFESEPSAGGSVLAGGVYGKVPGWLFGTLAPPSAAGPRPPANRRPGRP